MSDPAGWIAWGLATAALAVLFHTTTVRAVPYVVAWWALRAMRRRGYPLNTLVHRGLNDAQNCRTPLSVADALISVCRYDVTAGTVRIAIEIPAEAYWSMAFYRRRTDNFFTLDDAAVRAIGTREAVVVLHTGDTDPPADAAGRPVFRVVVPDRRGLILVRQIVSNPADAAAVAAAKAVQERSHVVGTPATGHAKPRPTV